MNIYKGHCAKAMARTKFGMIIGGRLKKIGELEEKARVQQSGQPAPEAGRKIPQMGKLKLLMGR